MVMHFLNDTHKVMLALVATTLSHKFIYDLINMWHLLDDQLGISKVIRCFISI